MKTIMPKMKNTLDRIYSRLYMVKVKIWNLKAKLQKLFKMKHGQNGPKGKQGKAGVPGRRGIQVSDPQLLLSRPPPCPPQKPSPACVPTGPAGAARAPGRGGATGPGGCRWTRWASWEGRSSRTAGEQDLGLTDGTSIWDEGCMYVWWGWLRLHGPGTRRSRFRNLDGTKPAYPEVPL